MFEIGNNLSVCIVSLLIAVYYAYKRHLQAKIAIIVAFLEEVKAEVEAEEKEKETN